MPNRHFHLNSLSFIVNPQVNQQSIASAPVPIQNNPNNGQIPSTGTSSQGQFQSLLNIDYLSLLNSLKQTNMRQHITWDNLIGLDTI